ASQRAPRHSLDGLAEEPVRVIAISDERPAPANAVLVPWMSYAETMPHCDLVITHGGSGTLHRALASGVPVLIWPGRGDMAENAARVDWAGVGVRLAPRFCTPWAIRLAVRRGLSTPWLRTSAAALAAWAQAHPGAEPAATQLERWAAAVVPTSV